MITLYHGSNVQIATIDLTKCHPYKDFGQAFYLSSDRKQANNVALARVDIFGGEVRVNAYQFDEKFLLDGTLSFKSFDGSSTPHIRSLLSKFWVCVFPIGRRTAVLDKPLSPLPRGKIAPLPAPPRGRAACGEETL